MAKTYRDLFTSNGTNTTNMRRLFFAIGAPESNIQKKKRNHKECESDLDIGVNISKIHNDDSISANRKATSKHSIAPARFIVNTTLLDDSDKLEKLGSISAAPIQPAAKLVNKPDRTFNLALENSFINYNFSKGLNFCQLKLKHW